MALAWFVELACDLAGVPKDTWEQLPQTQQINIIRQWETHICAKPDHYVKAANFKPQEPTMDTITTNDLPYDDFAKFDIRVGTITKAEPIPKSKKLLRLEVYFGEQIGSRVILSGISESYDPNALVGVQIVAVINLIPRKMMGMESHGMILAVPLRGASQRVAVLSCTNVEDGSPIG
jgi:methionine--tRNA ligase beta chain